jgi:hypothetical protein
MKRKTIIAGSFMFLLLGITLSPLTVSAQARDGIILKEVGAIDQFMDDVEQIASDSQSFSEFVQRFQSLSLKEEYARFPVVQNLINTILQKIVNEQELSIAGISLSDILGRFSIRLRPDYFVISFGAYHRLCPRKENSIDRFKEGLSMWRYSDTAKLLKGRTLVLERQPFGIHQKILGPQVGIMKGFRGIYIDLESRLTGNSYVFFIGRVHRIRAFDLTPLK